MVGGGVWWCVKMGEGGWDGWMDEGEVGGEADGQVFGQCRRNSGRESGRRKKKALRLTFPIGGRLALAADMLCAAQGCALLCFDGQTRAGWY